MKQRPILFNGEMVRQILAGNKTQTRRPVRHDLWLSLFFGELGENGMPWVEDPDTGWQGEIACPFGSPGDLLYVRETWARPWHHAQPHILYRATDDEVSDHPDFDGWMPSIHMPKRHARIWLRVTDVRVERVQAITWEDAIDEGIDTTSKTYGLGSDAACINCFRELWESAYPGSWDRNEWVWVVEFERTEAPDETK